MISQKRSSCVLVQTLGAISWNQTRLGAILPRFLEILPRFSRILRDFQYIKTLRGALSPPPQTPLVSTEFLTYQYTCVIASGVAFRCLLWIITLVFIFNDIHKPILGYRVNYSNLIFKKWKIPCKIDIYVAPLLFPWPRSGAPTFLFLESPLGITQFNPRVNTDHPSDMLRPGFFDRVRPVFVPNKHPGRRPQESRLWLLKFCQRKV